MRRRVRLALAWLPCVLGVALLVRSYWRCDEVSWGEASTVASDTGGLHFFHNDVVDGLAVSSGKAGVGGNTAGNVRAQGQLLSGQDEAGEIPPLAAAFASGRLSGHGRYIREDQAGVDAGVE